MSTLAQALALAARGFHIFPIKINGSTPLIEDFPNLATRDEAIIRDWWQNRSYNIGISTTRFGDNQALVVIDVDTKNEKQGNHSLLKLELEGYDLPVTLEQSTPSGGRHLIYVTDRPCKQGVDVLGSGLDIRSRGGYVLGPGSSREGKFYSQINGHSRLEQAPEWLVLRLGVDTSEHGLSRDPLPGIDSNRAAERSLIFLEDFAEPAVQGQGGDLATYRTAAQLKDYGCTPGQAFDLLMEHWNPKCDPPWDAEELEAKVLHVFKYGKDAPGIRAPEAVFPPVPPPPPEDKPKLHPFEAINSEYAFVKKGCFILQETTDHKGAFTTQHLSLSEFHGWHANKPFQAGNQRPKPVSEHWMGWALRRQYEGVVFSPMKDEGPRWYNLWRGFRVEPTEGKAMHPSLDAFKEHALVNVCGGDKELFHWLMGYFAHMIQRPWEKPLVALVFKGKKGTGKNALVERVGYLLGSHFLVADDDRYLLGNFNSHLEANLFFVLDEAAWAGDKKAEGRLKGLITGQQHNIERKGKEPYSVDNLTRVAIIGNEDWLVPASSDERRFAVFNLGDGRIQDRAFFMGMRESMEQGGYAHLLRYLMDFDLSTVDVNDAPKTQALVDQKHASLDMVEQWWFENIQSGQISGGDWAGEWPEAIPNNRLQDAFARWTRGRNIRSRLPTKKAFFKVLRTVAPNFKDKKVRPEDPKDVTYSFINPGLDVLRQDWESYIGGPIEWTEGT